MVKSTIITVMLLVAVLAGAQTPTANDFSRLSVRPLPHREVKTTVVSTEPRTYESPYTRLRAMLEEKQSPDFFSADGFSRHGIRRAEKGKECVDSIVIVNLAGAPVSKQTFTYTQVGLPAVCLSFLPGEVEDWDLYSRYFYEYDKQNRVIARESINNTSHSQDYRYEYIYTDASSNYTSEIFYIWDIDANEMVPFQYGEYTWDANGNVTSQTFYNWSAEVSDWIPVQKKTYTWDGQNRQTSYFGYVWDTAANDWVGSIDDGNCEEYVYAENGDDALIKGYVWENNAWLNYVKTIYTYDSNWNCIKDETVYWNRADQDWTGGDVWGPNGIIYRNTYADNTYDSANRMTRQDVFQLNSKNEYVLAQFMTDEFTDLDDGGYESVQIVNMAWQSPEPTPYVEVVERFNKWGSSPYYKDYTYVTGERMPRSEEIRYMDEYNNYLGGEFYSFNNEGKRYGQAKEQFIYADDYDPSSQLDTPVEGIIWRGVNNQTDEEWVLSNRDDYTWAYRDAPIMTSFLGHSFVNDVEVPTTGFVNEYDEKVPMEGNIIFWQDYNKRTGFYAFKILTSVNYANYDYYIGDTEWDDDFSKVDTYYYSLFDGSGVSNVALDSDVVEIARYDISGVRLDAPAKGVNIVCYSDGSVRKVVVR